MSKGIDYAWHDAIDWACLTAAGVTFICRYLSYDTGKDLTVAELEQAGAHEIAVAVVWETYADRMLAGFGAGKADAAEADRRLNLLGMAGCPLYFACDFDATEADQIPINAYLDGAAAAIGLPRTGMYGGYWPVKRAFDAGKLTFGWQTYAWSGSPTNWDTRVQLRQTLNGMTVCGLSADWDESRTADFGQWPRPGITPPQPPAPSWEDQALATIPTVQHGSSGQFVRNWQGLLVAHGYSLAPAGIDGVFGGTTDQRTRTYQGDHGLTVDGVVGPNTWARAMTS